MFLEMFAILGDEVRNGHPKVAKILFFAILGDQVLNGHPKIAK